ncbi:hypothetical protein MBLNU13_g05659t1 [Cladosporium sp. NU13]
MRERAQTLADARAVDRSDRDKLEALWDCHFNSIRAPTRPRNCSITALDFLCLRPGAWLTSNVVDAALATICGEHEQEYVSTYPIVSKELPENISKQLPLAWRADSTLVIMALIRPAALNWPLRNHFARDTMDIALQMAAAREPALNQKLNSKRFKLAPDQKQTNGYDCGVFLIAAAHNWLNNSAHSAMPLQRDMGPYRSEWINRFAKNHYDWKKSLTT